MNRCLLLAFVTVTFSLQLLSNLLGPLQATTLSCQTLSIPKNNTMISDRKGSSPAFVSHDTFIPIFIMSRDRLNNLRDAIQSYNRTISSPHEVIVLDHYSTYPPMLEYLRELNSSGVQVRNLRQKEWTAALKEMKGIISEYLNAHPWVDFYVVTDPDIALLRAAPDILLFLAGLLRSCPDVKVVGPHLQISDIPSSYNQRDQAIEWEKKYWNVVPNMATWNDIGYHVSEQPIDTTFAMRRRVQQFRRLQRPCLRTFAPYSSAHLGWYIDGNNTPEDQMWYLNHMEKKVNHW